MARSPMSASAALRPSAQLRELVCSFRARSSQSRAQSCREDQSSAAKRIETALTTSPTIQPATSRPTSTAPSSTPIPTMPPVAIARIAPRSIPVRRRSRPGTIPAAVAAARLPLAHGPRADRIPRQCLAARRPSWGGGRPASCCRESSRSAVSQTVRAVRRLVRLGGYGQHCRTGGGRSAPLPERLQHAEDQQQHDRHERGDEQRAETAQAVGEEQEHDCSIGSREVSPGGTRRRACSACWLRQMQEPGWIGRFQDCTRHPRRGVCLAAVLNGNSRQGRASNHVVRSSTSAGSGTRRPHSCGRLGFCPASFESRSEEDFK